MPSLLRSAVLTSDYLILNEPANQLILLRSADLISDYPILAQTSWSADSVPKNLEQLIQPLIYIIK